MASPGLGEDCTANLRSASSRTRKRKAAASGPPWPALTSSVSSDDASRPGRYSIGDSIDLKHSKPVYVEICGDKFPVSSWRQLAETVCKQLANLDTAIFETFLIDEDFSLRGGGRQVSSSKDSLRNPCEVMPDVFVETHYQANDLRDLIAKVSEKYELEDEIFYELER